MKRLNLKFILLGLAFIFIVSIFPLMMDRWIIGNTVYSNINNSDWVSFLGSYIGAILGGICTLLALHITIKNENAKHKELLKLSSRGYISVEDMEFTPILYDYEPNITKKVIELPVYKRYLQCFKSGRRLFRV